MRFFLLVLAIYTYPLYAKVSFIKDVKVGDKKLPKASEVIVTSTEASNWYQLFDNNKAEKGFAPSDCVSIQGKELLISKTCSLKKEPYNTAPEVGSATKGTKYKFFALSKATQSNVMFNGQVYKVPSDTLKYSQDDIDPSRFEEASIEQMVKLKKEKTFMSPYVDKTIYVSTSIGVFASFDGRKWFRLKKLESKKYEIGVTEDGWILADNLVSKDYGRNFFEFFPSHAYPYKDAYVKSIVISPEGGNSIYLTFSTPVDSSDITLFVMSDVNNGWKRIYPTVDGRVITIPAEDSMTSILSYVNNHWMQSNRYSKTYKLDLEDIEVVGQGRSRSVSMLIKAISSIKKRTRNYHVALSLDYLPEQGWVVRDEKWRFI
jgi:hypothetical protein